MPARQYSRVDLPEPLGPITARTSPRFTETLAPRSAGVSPKENTRSRASMITPPTWTAEELFAPFMTPLPPRVARVAPQLGRSSAGRLPGGRDHGRRDGRRGGC